MKKTGLKLFITGMLISWGTILSAQPGGGGGGQGNGGNPPAGVPIDGGAISLIIGSAYYGYKKIKEKRNSGEE